MLTIAITPHWTITGADGRVLGPRVVDLLVRVSETGSLAAACKADGLSYRHAWQLVREGEAVFGGALLTMARGRGSQLTPIGERLVWAHRRVRARLAPTLDTLASELGAELEKVLSPQPRSLRIHASHGFAVQALHRLLGQAAVPHELRYCGSAEALAALASGQCELAGFHVPEGEFEPAAVEHYRRWLDPSAHRLLCLARRRQGLLTQPGNPKKIYGVDDLARPGVRFVNRQSGSGTRFLLDLMLAGRGIAPADIHGYEQCEFTHAAVAAFVASGMADVGMGVEPPARQFQLQFLPLQSERYFLLCRADQLESPWVRQVVTVMRSAALREAVESLPGYACDRIGEVVLLEDALPTLRAQGAPHTGAGR